MRKVEYLKIFNVGGTTESNLFVLIFRTKRFFYLYSAICGLGDGNAPNGELEELGWKEKELL